MATKPTFDCGTFGPGSGRPSDPPDGGDRHDPWDPDRTDPRNDFPGPEPYDPDPKDPCETTVQVWTCYSVSYNPALILPCVINGQLCKCIYNSQGVCADRTEVIPCDEPYIFGPNEYRTKDECLANCPNEYDVDCNTTPPDPGDPSTPGPGTLDPSSATDPQGPKYTIFYECKQNQAPGTRYLCNPPPNWPPPGCVPPCPFPNNLNCYCEVTSVGTCSPKLIRYYGQTPPDPASYGMYPSDAACQANCPNEIRVNCIPDNQTDIGTGTSATPEQCSYTYWKCSLLNIPGIPYPCPGPGGVCLCYPLQTRLCTSAVRIVECPVGPVDYGQGEYPTKGECEIDQVFCQPTITQDCDVTGVGDSTTPGGPLQRPPNGGGGGGGITPTGPSSGARGLTPAGGGGGGGITPTGPSSGARGLTPTGGGGGPGGGITPGPQSGAAGGLTRRNGGGVPTGPSTGVRNPSNTYAFTFYRCEPVQGPVTPFDVACPIPPNAPTGTTCFKTYLGDRNCKSVTVQVPVGSNYFVSPTNNEYLTMADCLAACTPLYTPCECDYPTPIGDLNTPGSPTSTEPNGGGNNNGGGSTTPPFTKTKTDGSTTPGGLVLRIPGTGGGTSPGNGFPTLDPIARVFPKIRRTKDRRVFNNGASQLPSNDNNTDPPIVTRVYNKCVKQAPVPPRYVNCQNPNSGQFDCKCYLIKEAKCIQEVVTQNPDGSFPPPTPPYVTYSINNNNACLNNVCFQEVSPCISGPQTPEIFTGPSEDDNSPEPDSGIPFDATEVNPNDPYQDPYGQLVLTESVGPDTLALNQDPDTSFLFRNPRSFEGNIVDNPGYYTDILAPRIHKSILYVLENSNRSSNWDTKPISDITDINIEKSLNREFLETLKLIKRCDSKEIDYKIFIRVIKSKLLTGEMDSIDPVYYRRLAAQEDLKIVIPRKTQNKDLNILKAFAYLEKKMIPLDPNEDPGSRNAALVPLYKVLATDVEKALPLFVDGEERKVFINDNDIVIGRAGLRISDGDYVTLGSGSTSRRLYLRTEKDHAYTITAFDKAVALDLLNGNPYVTISASSSYSSMVEFTSDLSALRQDVYFLKLNTSTINTSRKTPYLDATVAKYDLMPTVTDADVSAINEYVKFKLNHKVFHIQYDDMMIDHMLQSSAITLSQDDIRFDGHARKTNKQVPILVRQLPWYILVFPTDKNELNSLLSRSKIETFNTSIVQRSLNYILSVNRDIYNPLGRASSFMDINLNYPEKNVFDEYDFESRKIIFNKDNPIFKTGYKNGQPTPRKKTGLRISYEIVNELNNNYVLDRGLTTFDLFSRMNFSQFNQFATDLGEETYNQIKQGVFGAAVYSVTKYSGDPYIFKTALKSRRSTATEDTYTQIKATNTGYYVQPPTRTEQPRLIIRSNQRPLRG